MIVAKFNFGLKIALVIIVFGVNVLDGPYIVPPLSEAGWLYFPFEFVSGSSAMPFSLVRCN